MELSLEEKKAIKSIKNLIYGVFDEIIIKDAEGYTPWNDCFEIVVSLIEKQQKEIEELKEEHNSKYYHTLKLKELENEINNDWENKIKAEIKELEQMGLDDDIFGKMRNYAILILKELLGE